MTEDGSFSAGSKPIVAKYLLCRIVSRFNLQTFQALNRLEASSTGARSFLPSSLAPKLDADMDVYLTPGRGRCLVGCPYVGSSVLGCIEADFCKVGLERKVGCLQKDGAPSRPSRVVFLGLNILGGGRRR